MTPEWPADGPYQLYVKPAIEAWLAESSPSVDEKLLVADFLDEVILRPEEVATMTSGGTGLPLHSAIAPGTDTQVVWFIVKSPPYPPSARRVEILRIKRAPVD